MTKKNDELGMLVYRIEAPHGISVANYETLPKHMRTVFPVGLGEAIRSAISIKEPLRVENIEGHFALMWIEKDANGLEVNSTHLHTYKGRNDALALLERKQIPTVEQANFIAAFEHRVNAVLGTMPAAKCSQNTINYIMSYCRGVRIREDGGTYFVPKIREERFVEYANAVGAIGINVQFADCACNGRTIANIAIEAKRDLSTRIVELLEKVGEMKRESAIAERVEEIGNIIDTIELYELALSTKLTELREGAEAAREIIRNRAGLV